MTAVIAPIAALLLSVALLLTGNGLQGTLLPVRASLEGFSPIEIGVLGSSYFLGFVVGCFYGPRVVRRVGHIRTFAALVAIASSLALLHAINLQPVVWWLLRAGTGFCFAILYMVIESWLNDKSTNENRGFVFSIYTIINLTVITLGQLMLMLDEPTTFTLFALASILVSLAAVPVALTRSPAPAPIATVKISIPRLYKLSPVGVMGCAAVGLVNGTFWALGPVFAQSGGKSTRDIALFMGIVVIAGAIGQWPLGRLSDQMDRRKVIVFACAGAALAGVGSAVFAQAWAGATLVFAFFFGFFAFSLYALSVAHMNDFVGRDDYVETAGGLLLVFALGAVVGPIFASVAIRYAGIENLFAYTAVVHTLAGAYVFYRMRQRERAPKEEHVPFIDSLQIAQTVSVVDPLSPEIDLPLQPNENATDRL